MLLAQPPSSFLSGQRFPPLAKHGWGGKCLGGNRRPRTTSDTVDKIVLSGSEWTSAGLRTTAQGLGINRPLSSI